MPDETTVIASDGLPARRIKPHTREKFDRHAKYCGIFNRGMDSKWPNRLGYLELFAGSGLAVERGDELDGCPLIAAAAEPGFTRMAFVEQDVELAAALEERLRRRGIGPDRALILAGDANDPFVLATAAAFLPAPGLIFAFIDPEDINGHWDAIRFLANLATRRQRFDFLINLPVGPMFLEAPRAAGRPGRGADGEGPPHRHGLGAAARPQALSRSRARLAAGRRRLSRRYPAWRLCVWWETRCGGSFTASSLTCWIVLLISDIGAGV